MTNTAAAVAVGAKVELADVHATGYGLTGRVLRVTSSGVVIVGVDVECPRTFDTVTREYPSAKVRVIG